nr:MAG TPA: hypothetical protein [Caudoviricetes sp.]
MIILYHKFTRLSRGFEKFFVIFRKKFREKL